MGYPVIKVWSLHQLTHAASAAYLVCILVGGAFESSLDEKVNIDGQYCQEVEQCIALKVQLGAGQQHLGLFTYIAEALKMASRVRFKCDIMASLTAIHQPWLQAILNTKITASKMD